MVLVIRFLLTASTPTYRILVRGNLTEEDRTISVLSSEPLTDGKLCDIDVSITLTQF